MSVWINGVTLLFSVIVHNMQVSVNTKTLAINYTDDGTSVVSVMKEMLIETIESDDPTPLDLYIYINAVRLLGAHNPIFARVAFEMWNMERDAVIESDRKSNTFRLGLLASIMKAHLLTGIPVNVTDFYDLDDPNIDRQLVRLMPQTLVQPAQRISEGCDIRRFLVVQ